MAILALVFLVLFLAIGLGLQGWLQHRRTGYSVLRALYRRPLSKEWWIGECWVVGFFLIALAAVLDLYGVVRPVEVFSGAPRLAGVVIALSGFAFTEWAVVSMGESWRVDVNESERTALVTGGPFRLVRNPIYSGMILLTIGLTLMVPTLVSLAGAGFVILGLELQVRALEDPYLLRTHDDAWLAYASGVGRFVPGVGRLTAIDQPRRGRD